MDKDNLELIQATVKGLQDKIGSLNMELKDKIHELDDINKPAISNDIYKELESVISDVVDHYTFECGQFDYEFSLDYDNRIELSELDFRDRCDITDSIMRQISDHFKTESDETNQ